MQIKAEQLQDTLKILSGVVKENKISPALEGVLINKTSITGGNDVLTIKLPFENDLPECLLEFETLLKMSKSLNGLLEVKQGAKVIEFKGSNGKISVPIIEGEYPLINPENKHPEFFLTYDEVQEVSKLANFIDPKGRYLGIYHNGLSFAATNAAMCGFYEKVTVKGVSIAVYPEVFRALLPIPADQFAFKNGEITAAENGKIIAIVKYLDLQENPPNFEAIVPKNMPITATSSTFDFKNLLSLLSISVNQKSNIAELNWLPFSLIGKSKEVEFNKESEGEIEIDTDGLDEPLRMGMNIRLLETCINYLDSESVSINMEKQDKAVIITGLEPAKKCLLMPFVI